MAKKDRAVATAIDILNRSICECGHLRTEHYEDAAHSCAGDVPSQGCDERCIRFRPVKFKVERA